MKNYILTMILSGLSLTMSAQNPVANIIKVYTDDAVIEDTVLNESYSFEFIGNPGKLSAIINGETVTWNEGNTSLYGIVPQFVDYDRPMVVRLVADKDLVKGHEVGFVISTKPVSKFCDDKLLYGGNRGLSDDEMFGNVYMEYPDGDIDTLMSKDAGYYMSRCISDNEGVAIVDLGRPKFLTTYYILPYMKLDDTEIMYGDVKTFVTTKTKLGVLSLEDYLAEIYDDVIMRDAIVAFCNDHAELKYVLDHKYYQNVLAKYMVKYIERKEIGKDVFAQSIAEVEKCVDGDLGLVAKLPEDFASRYFNSLKDTIEIDLLKDFNTETSSDGMELYSKYLDYNDPVNYCEMQTSDNKKVGYYDFMPVTDSSLPCVAFNVPAYLRPISYDVYAVIVNPEGSKPNKFRARSFCEDENGVMGSPVRLKSLVDGTTVNSIVSDKECETLYVGSFDGNGTNTVLQFVLAYQVKEKMNYSNDLRLARVFLVPSDSNK